ncbi:GNAT family N-acetyltransferase [Clostridium lacusfryxellense]|uniref:GNAT family N-acetyltransferase n=1 Tax=Clostridium lacusfryxellense TaxID=205328 RepID=UPI001C0BD9A3|nr:GNAT family N-acetyltransferase [Clostridium lacusfryxellense]MBU3113672.1 GNAT family N-acetyltransferase [Clostridium lacusfryxellense]
MRLTTELINQGFSLQEVGIDDLGNYIDVKRVCYKKYVDEYYGGWIENIQIRINTDAFNDMMKEICFQKLLLNNVPVGFFAYNELDDKIESISIQILEVSQNKGVGSFYLQYITSLSQKVNKPIFLKVFKSNPAQNLYKRFGFDNYSETETHYLMRYNPIKSQ